jgi:hypothetical protein
MRLLWVICSLLLFGSMWSDNAAASNYKVSGQWRAYGNPHGGTVGCGGMQIPNVDKVVLFTSPNAGEPPIINVFGTGNTILASYVVTAGVNTCMLASLSFQPGDVFVAPGDKQDNQ